VPVAAPSLLVMMRENRPKDTSLVLHWCSVQNAGCAAMPTEMPALSSANASLLVSNSPSLRKSLKLLWQQRGPRKWEVFQAPKSPKAKEGPLPTTQGMEQGTRRAPRRIHCSGRRTVHQVLLTNSGCSTSRSHATDTRTTDYVAVPEEAAPLERLRSVTVAHMVTVVPAVYERAASFFAKARLSGTK
jgi:hypothetical protein